MTGTPGGQLPEVETMPCPMCDAKTLRVEWRLVAKPIGNYSIAGARTKVVATETPFLVCGSCDLVVEGKRS